MGREPVVHAHALDDGLVVHPCDPVGAQGLHAVDMLHDGAGIARAHLVLMRAKDPDLPPRERDGGRQQQEGRQHDDTGGNVEPERERAEHNSQGRRLDNLARPVRKDLLVVIHVDRERLQVLAARALVEAGQRDALDGVSHCHS